MEIELGHGLWVEKYRPRRLGEIVDQEEVVRALTGFAAKKAFPHLLFSGPPGTGKTTAALALANEMYGSEEIARENLLELNASDERGIDTIRGGVKDFARSVPTGGVPFKMIYLDEADQLTTDAQHALRRTMEIYSSNTRFILACNYSSRIIGPIQSRTAIFRFEPIPGGLMKQRLSYIAQNEGVNARPDGIDAIVRISGGDLRRATNLLQTAAVTGREVDEAAIYDVAGLAEPERIKEMVSASLRGDFIEARSILRDLMISRGISGKDIVRQIYQEILRSREFSDEKKATLISYIGETDFRLTEGSYEDIQLSALLAKLTQLGSES